MGACPGKFLHLFMHCFSDNCLFQCQGTKGVDINTVRGHPQISYLFMNNY